MCEHCLGHRYQACFLRFSLSCCSSSDPDRRRTPTQHSQGQSLFTFTFCHGACKPDTKWSTRPVRYVQHDCRPCSCIAHLAEGHVIVYELYCMADIYHSLHQTRLKAVHSLPCYQQPSYGEGTESTPCSNCATESVTVSHLKYMHSSSAGQLTCQTRIRRTKFFSFSLGDARVVLRMGRVTSSMRPYPATAIT